jgi:hypothetical protein
VNKKALRQHYATMKTAFTAFLIHLLAWNGVAMADGKATFVVLPSEAMVHIRPDTTSPTSPLTDFQPRADFTLIEFMGQENDWMRLQTTTTSHGYMERVGHLKPYVVTLFYPRTETQPVLTSLHRFTDENGLEQLVLPGQPLQANSDGSHRFAAGPLESLGTVKAEQVGSSFTMTTLEDWLPRDDRRLCTLDDGLLEANQTCTEPNALGAAQDATERVYRVRTDDNGPIALVKRNQWHYTERRVKATSKHGEPRTDTTFGPVMGVIGGPIQSGKIVRLTKGTDVFWMDGTVAGQVRYNHSVSDDRFEAYGDLRCTGLPPQAPGSLGGLGRGPTHGPKPIKDYPAQLCIRPE